MPLCIAWPCLYGAVVIRMLPSFRLPTQVHGPVRPPQWIHVPRTAVLPVHEHWCQPVCEEIRVLCPGCHGCRGGGQGVEGGQGVVPVTASVALRTLCDPRLLVPGAFGWMVYVPM